MTTRACPSCGAGNPEDAPWCGQCYRPFQRRDDGGAVEEETPAPPGPPPPPGTASRPPGPAPGPPPPPGVRSRPDSRPAWRCPVCEEQNPAQESICPTCGTTIFEAFGVGEAERPEVSVGTVVGWSVVFPGLGHRKAGQGLLGAAVGLLTATTVIFGLVLGFGSGQTGLASLLLLVVLGLWTVAALDAYRWARGERREVLLRPRVISILAGLILVVFLFGIGQGIGSVQP